MAIHGFMRRKERFKMKEYVFTGIWSWACYADSGEEAWKQFNECYLDEIDCNFYNVNVEEIEDNESLSD